MGEKGVVGFLITSIHFACKIVCEYKKGTEC